MQLKTLLNCGSLFYNYKGFNSLILLALVNHGYEFVDAEECMSDGGVWRERSLGEALSKSTAHSIFTTWPAC